MNSDEKALRKLIDRHLPSPSNEEMTADCDRVLEQLQSRPAHLQKARVADVARPSRVWWRLTPMRAAAALVFLALLSVPLIKMLVFPENVYAIVEKVSGSVYQGSGRNERTVTAGDRIASGTPVRTNGNAAAVLALPGGSRIEMHAKSELSLEQAEDGLRIRLNDGSVNVTPAKEPAGKLYLQDREVTIPVLGSFFKIAGLPVFQNPEPRVAFDVASIRPSGPIPVGGGGGRGGGGVGRGDGSANFRPNDAGCVPAVSRQLDPSRLAITRATLFQFIGHAYPVQTVPDGGNFLNCGLLHKIGFVSGGPEWVKTDMWDLEAAISGGVFTSTPSPGDPKLQQMLQTLLSERFKLVMRRETRELPVYLLKVGKDGPKFNGHGENRKRMTFLDADGRPKPASEFPPPPDGGFSIIGNRFLDASNFSMANFVQFLFGLDHRPVFDRTGLTGRYDFHFYADAEAANARPLSGGLEALKRDAVKALGFELEESRQPFDVWVIERADKPAEN
jgi:uncharacterized protein (TIGR03435 family)